MAEFEVQQKPEVAPRKCLFCDSFEPKGGWVTTFTLNDRGQTMLICVPCALLIADKVGCLSPASAKKLKDQVRVAEEAWEGAQLAVSRIREQVTELVT